MMKKEELLAMGLTEEQADKVLEENGKDVGKAIKKSEGDKAKYEAELARLKAIEETSKELQINYDELVSKNQTAEEKAEAERLKSEKKLQDAIAQAEATKADFEKQILITNAKAKLSTAGYTEEEVAEITKHINAESVGIIDAMISSRQAKIDAVTTETEARVKKELLDKTPTPKPGGPGGTPGAAESKAAQYAQKYSAQKQGTADASANGGNPATF